MSNMALTPVPFYQGILIILTKKVLLLFELLFFFIFLILYLALLPSTIDYLPNFEWLLHFISIVKNSQLL